MTLPRLTRFDYMNFGHIREVAGHMERIRLLKGQLFGINFALGSIHLALDMLTFPTPAFFNIIERNIGILALGNEPQGLPPTRTWYGENRDNPRMDYRDINRWYESLDMIEREIISRL